MQLNVILLNLILSTKRVTCSKTRNKEPLQYCTGYYFVYSCINYFTLLSSHHHGNLFCSESFFSFSGRTIMYVIIPGVKLFGARTYSCNFAHDQSSNEYLIDFVMWDHVTASLRAGSAGSSKWPFAPRAVCARHICQFYNFDDN